MGSIIWTANMRTSLLFVCSFIAVGITVPVPDPDISITTHCYNSLCNQDNVLDGVEGPPEKIVLSSEGEAANVQGGVLGEYKYDSQKNHYVQSNSEIFHEQYEPKYLYRDDEYEDWVVDGLLWNANKGNKVPNDYSWEVFDGEEWIVDPDLIVITGALRACKGATLYGAGPVAQNQGNYLGEYKVTNKKWNGHPVYKSNNGGLLHMSSDGYWTASDRLGQHNIRGLPGRLCPSESNKWEYWDGSKSQPANILVVDI